MHAAYAISIIHPYTYPFIRRYSCIYTHPQISIHTRVMTAPAPLRRRLVFDVSYEPAHHRQVWTWPWPGLPRRTCWRWVFDVSYDPARNPQVWMWPSLPRRTCWRWVETSWPRSRRAGSPICVAMASPGSYRRKHSPTPRASFSWRTGWKCSMSVSWRRVLTAIHPSEEKTTAKPMTTRLM